MKGLALETVVKWIILLVVAGVVINLIFFFSEDIKRFLEVHMGREGVKAEVIESEEFSTSQLKTFIRACWEKTGETFREDVVCYILRGSVSGVDPTALKNALEPPASVDVSNFDPSKKVTLIRFEDVGNRVIVES